MIARTQAVTFRDIIQLELGHEKEESMNTNIIIHIDTETNPDTPPFSPPVGRTLDPQPPSLSLSHTHTLHCDTYCVYAFNVENK